MNHSDDYPSDYPSSANPPFTGDSTGSIFDLPDMVQSSDATTERVVDTQSGFLVVVKPLDSRLALSVKRRLGTPPVSYITLTPDESLKLSKILGNFKDAPSAPKKGFLFGRGGEEKSAKKQRNSDRAESADSRATTRSGASENDVLDADGMNQVDLEGSPFGEDPSTEFARYAAQTDGKRAKSYRERRAARRDHKITGGQIVTVCVCLIGLPALIWAAAFFAGKHSQPAPKPVPIADLEKQKIDQFSRDFVADMLDFNPTTYRASQIRAMSTMTPELIDKYWKETSFPLTAKQLEQAPHNQTLLISNIDQSGIVENQRKVDIYAELVNSDNQKKRPVHLRLTVEDNGQPRVLNQEDLSAAK